jgi:hypothetical protein
MFPGRRCTVFGAVCWMTVAWQTVVPATVRAAMALFIKAVLYSVKDIKQIFIDL